eukprot:gene22052-29116_t
MLGCPSPPHQESIVEFSRGASVEAVMEVALGSEYSSEGVQGENDKQQKPKQPYIPLDDYYETLLKTCGSLKELEERYQLVGVWGQKTTTALQILDCIKMVKEKMIDKDDEDDGDIMSSSLFILLFTASFLATVLAKECIGSGD